MDGCRRQRAVGRSRDRRCPLIARLWSAQATPAQAPAYAEHLRTQVVPELRCVDGYAGAMLLKRETPDADAVELTVITLWQSLDSIRGFTGTDVEGAVVANEAAAVLTQFDDRVRHYEVVVKDDATIQGQQ